MSEHDFNFKKNELNKMKKNDLINLINTRTNIVLEGKNTKTILIKHILEYQNRISTKQNTKPNTKQNTKQTSPKKKKRGRRAKTELNIESIIANNETIKDTKNNDPNIIVHLSGVTLDSIKQLKTNKDPL